MKHNPESEAPVPRNSHHSLNIDHHGASSLIRDASVCDLAVEKASTGDYRAAYDTIVQILDGDSPLRPRAVEIAAKLIDKIVDEYEEENYEAAIPWLDRWLSIDPEALYPAVAKADMLWLYLDRPSDAARIYQSVVRKHPYCLEGWIGLAQIALSQRHYRRALRYLRRAWLSLSHPVWAFSPPTREIVVNIIESLYAATAKALAATGRKPEGINMLERAISDWGSSEYLLQTLDYVEKMGTNHDDE